MSGKTTEYMLFNDACEYLRTQGTPVEPAKVESFVRARAAQEGTLLPGATPTEITTATNALLEQANLTTNERSTSMGKTREFAGATRDGKNAGVVKMEQLEEAQQYQPHVPYWNEPRLSPTRRQAIETQAEGLRAQLRMDLTLTPGLRIRIEQELKQLERVLERAGSGDAVPPAQRSM